MFKIFLIISILCLLSYCYFIEPNMLTITRYRIKCSNLSGLKAVFVGDFHIKKNGEERLDKIVKLIKAQEPDIIFSTGDFVAGHTLKTSLPPEKIAEKLGELKPKLGFYTVLGNHDWWADGKLITEVLRKNGIVVLENSSVSFIYKNKPVYIAGIEDLQTRNPDITSAMEHTSSPLIMLTHTPDMFPKIPDNVFLTLAGHTHGGQVRIPFLGALIIPSEYREKYAKGKITENNHTMIVTKGIGTSILPFRFNCTPEIVIINFEE